MTNASEGYGLNQAYDREPAFNFFGAMGLPGAARRTYTGENAIPTTERQKNNTENHVRSFDFSSFFSYFRGNI